MKIPKYQRLDVTTVLVGVLFLAGGALFTAFSFPLGWITVAAAPLAAISLWCGVEMIVDEFRRVKEWRKHWSEEE